MPFNKSILQVGRTLILEKVTVKYVSLRVSFFSEIGFFNLMNKLGVSEAGEEQNHFKACDEDEVPLRDHSGGRPKCSHPLKSVEELTGDIGETLPLNKAELYRMCLNGCILYQYYDTSGICYNLNVRKPPRPIIEQFPLSQQLGHFLDVESNRRKLDCPFNREYVTSKCKNKAFFWP
ncbi:hypothetical protein BDB01DRAFT_831197 [Pilobolus umbonatus]|nr:hypothetical protein BDB01DRAFT_831197 [Pilobolus umbonatus]